MRKLIYSMFVSLDGFINGPNREIDWHVVDEELHGYVNEQERAIDTFLFGRRMYEVMKYWDTADKDPSNPPHVLEFARIWQTIPKIVFSKTLGEVGPNARLMREVVADEITTLKQQPGKTISVGGAGLAAGFIGLGLIDEYQSYVHPVVLAGGTPMFQPSDQRIHLRHLETRTLRSGVTHIRYAPQ